MKNTGTWSHYSCDLGQVTTFLVLFSYETAYIVPNMKQCLKALITAPSTWQEFNTSLLMGCFPLFPCILSIMMTTCSTFCALGMMPLLLFIYSKGIYDGDLKDKVPYGGIMLSLVMILIPCTIGIFLKSKRPQYVPYIKKVRWWGSYLWKHRRQGATALLIKAAYEERLTLAGHPLVEPQWLVHQSRSTC